MINPYYLTDRILKIAFIINLDSHHINHLNSKITIKYNYLEIEKNYVIKIVKQMANIYARLSNQIKFKYQTVFSARFDKQDEDDQVLDEIELYINLKYHKNSTQSDIDNNDVRSQLKKKQIENQETKDSGWRFQSHYISLKLLK